jgi:CxxC-x17-CxxC domain-containing protein
MNILKEEDITIFGKTNYRGEEKPFGIKSDDRRRHMYIIGKTGMGKSALLRNLVVQDIVKGRGVAFVDPHGETAEEVLRFVPKNRINDVVYFNPSDLEHPVAFNVLEAVDEDHKHLIASGMMGVFKKIWPDVWSPRMEYILNNTILALLDYPGSTMLGINRMMSENEFRQEVIRKVKDPIVRSFWLEEFGKWDQRFAREATAAIQNKVGQFISTPIVRHIVGQTKSTINMRQIMDEGKVLIVNLAKGKIGEEAMALLGGMVVTRLYLAAMERVDTAEGARRDFYLYVDEFQNFATESFASILSEARKYRLNLIVAHQYIAQLTEQVRDAVFGNVGTLIAFRIGAADAEFVEKEFEPLVMMNDIINLPKFEIYLKLMIDGIAGNAFSAKTLPPFPPPPVTFSDSVIQVSQERYSRPRQEIEDKIKKWMQKDFMPRQPEGRIAPSERDRRDARNRPGQSRTGGIPHPAATSVSKKEVFSPRSESSKETPPAFMAPSQIVGFAPGDDNTMEVKMRQEIAKTAPKKIVKKQEPVETAASQKPKPAASPVQNQFAQKPQKSPTVWREAVCDRCGKKTKIPFEPEAGRGIYCKECLREVRRQKALVVRTRKNEKMSALPKPAEKKPSPRVSDEQREKYKEDLRKILAKIKAKEK